MYKSSEAFSYCFGPAQSTVAGSSLTSLVLSSWRCCLLLMQSLSDWLQPAGQLIWAPFLPYCPVLVVLALHAKRHKILASTKCWLPPRFHWFSPNFSSQYLCSQASYQKMVKAKSYHHHCPILVFLLLISIWRPSRRSSATSENCSNWRWGEGGEGGGRCGTLIRSDEGGTWANTRCHVFWSLDPPSEFFSFVLLFALLLAAWETLFRYPIR
jgi:hypothetical protein